MNDEAAIKNETEEAEVDGVPIRDIVEAFKATRDEKKNMEADFKAVMEPVNTRLKMLEAALLKFMNKSSLTQLRVDGVGLVYRSDFTSYTIKDRTAFNKWIVENGELDMLSSRVAASAVAGWEEAHDGQLPPGVDKNVVRHVRMRKA